MTHTRILGALAFLSALGASAADPGPAAATGLSIESAGHSFQKAPDVEAVVIGASPAIYLELDREYGVVRIKGNPNAFDLLPQDDQSALGLILWGASRVPTEEELSRVPGYKHGSSRTMEVAGEKVVWRQWADANHFFSDCTVHVPTGGAERLAVYLNVTANSPKRRRALEDHAPSIRVAGPQDAPPPLARVSQP
jgi:hypothetical protein